MHMDFSRRKITTPVEISYATMPLETESVISHAT